MKLETLAVHGGYEPEATTKAVAVPVYQTTSYAFDDTQHGADLFDLKREGNIYTRIMNPTTAVLEKRIAELEGGVGALGLASGMAAVTNAIFTIAGSGDNIISTHTLYGGTYNLFAHALPRLGIDVRFADPDDMDALAAHVDARTRLVFCETIGNPAGNVADLAALAELAHAHGLPLMVDNTVPTPVLCRPFEHGADIVIHSLTKYMGGHGTSIGGIVVDSGNFPWQEHADRFAMMSEPDASYHGVVYTDLGAGAYIARVRVIPLRNMGAALSPFNSFLLLHGLETLPLYEEMVVSGAWWDLVDDVATHKLRELVDDRPAEMAAHMRAWSRDPNLWKRRSSIICQIKRKEATDLALLRDCIEHNLGDPDFFIRKAIGWALRDLAWTDLDTVEEFVARRAGRLSPLSRREALKNAAAIRAGRPR